MIRAVSFNTDIQEVICSSTFQFVNIFDHGFILSDSQSLVYTSFWILQKLVDIVHHLSKIYRGDFSTSRKINTQKQSFLG
jgi:hypothetical protein